VQNEIRLTPFSILGCKLEKKKREEQRAWTRRDAALRLRGSVFSLLRVRDRSSRTVVYIIEDVKERFESHETSLGKGRGKNEMERNVWRWL